MQPMELAVERGATSFAPTRCAPHASHRNRDTPLSEPACTHCAHALRPLLAHGLLLHVLMQALVDQALRGQVVQEPVPALSRAPWSTSLRPRGCDSSDCLYCQYAENCALHTATTPGRLCSLLRKRSLSGSGTLPRPPAVPPLQLHSDSGDAARQCGGGVLPAAAARRGNAPTAAMPAAHTTQPNTAAAESEDSASHHHAFRRQRTADLAPSGSSCGDLAGSDTPCGGQGTPRWADSTAALHRNSGDVTVVGSGASLQHANSQPNTSPHRTSRQYHRRRHVASHSPFRPPDDADADSGQLLPPPAVAAQAVVAADADALGWTNPWHSLRAQGWRYEEEQHAPLQHPAPARLQQLVHLGMPSHRVSHDMICALEFSADGRLLATGSMAKQVRTCGPVDVALGRKRGTVLAARRGAPCMWLPGQFPVRHIVVTHLAQSATLWSHISPRAWMYLCDDACT